MSSPPHQCVRPVEPAMGGNAFEVHLEKEGSHQEAGSEVPIRSGRTGGADDGLTACSRELRPELPREESRHEGSLV